MRDIQIYKKGDDDNKLYTKEQVIKFIENGRAMLLSGSREALEGLPAGNWIAGTTPYFMDTVGKMNEDMIFVDDFSRVIEEWKIEVFDASNIHEIAKRGYKNGFIVVTMPIDSEVYYNFANHSLEYENIYDNPLVGYVSCCKFSDFGKVQTFSGSGLDCKFYTDKACALYIGMPKQLSARCEIMNFDTIDKSTPKVVFPKTSFVQSDCTIDGKPGNISDYLENVVKPKLGGYTQFITSQNGALINRDPRVVNTQTGETSFFSPVYAGDEYYLVKNGSDYLKMFNDELAKKSDIDIAATFSCISYYFGGNFEGRSVCRNGVYAFGEIAYQLLNKTIVTLEIDYIGPREDYHS